MSHATDSDLFQIFKLIVSTREKILNNINVEARRQVTWGNSLLPIAVRGSKTLRAYAA